ncbi:putative membrane protein [Collimonas arenae]|uniref:Putative membrane protein n=1 Tax=Collimonas arenae TaxID=279058 RepID=A0A127QQ21_9BURK|nr:hypothetical protein [Collimonas arenae]AMP02197.1 putative membrane protein [Collimonas arenae]AMP12094.1 putative membrane protein [Collimonas arenae]
MAIPAHPSFVVSAGIAALIVWRLYSRIRRTVGRQKLSNVRPWITICFFTWLVGMLLLGSITNTAHAAAIAGGVLLGAGLGVFGHRLTKFEKTSEGMFYTPSLHLGIALSLLFIVRIGYRAIQLFYFSSEPVVWPSANLSGSPLTLLIFGILAGYYVTYAIGLLHWRYSTRAHGTGIAQGPDNT